MRKIISLLIILSLMSCKLTHEQRKINRKSKKIERIAIKYGLNRADTIKGIVQYITQPKQIDTVFTLESDTVYRDTAIIVRIFPPAHFKYEKEGVRVNLDRIDSAYYYWKYSVSVKVDKDTVQVPFEVTKEVIAPVEYVPVPVELTKWQQFRMNVGTFMLWLLLAAIIILIIRTAIKFNKPI